MRIYGEDILGKGNSRWTKPAWSINSSEAQCNFNSEKEEVGEVRGVRGLLEIGHREANRSL